MERPRRQAAVLATEKMMRIREWEELPETSKRFRECAARIEAEFRAEERNRHVRAEDIASECEDEESVDEFVSADEDFVSSDSESHCSEYVPHAEEIEAAQAEEDATSSSACTESDIGEQAESDSEDDECSCADASSAETICGSQLSQASTSPSQVATSPRPV
jgi:hypothetical protein